MGDPTVANDAAAALAATFMTIGCVYLGVMAFFIAMYWSIFAKAGFNGARAFLLLIPIVNLIIMIMFAFGEWPIRREVEMLRMQVQMQGQGPSVQQISLSTNPPPQYPPASPYPPQQPPYPQG